MSDGVDGRPIGAGLRARVADGRMPGAVWWVGDASGPVDAGVVGRAAVEPVAEPVASDTIYDLASLTKPLATAVAALTAVRDGRWSLGDRVGRWLPELEGSAFAPATLDDLGSHRAGFPSWRPLYLESADRGGYLTALRSCPPAGRIGEERYSDLGYIALGFAVERVFDRDLAEVFADLVAVPLGLSRTGYAVGDGPWASAAPTERGNGYERAMAGAAGRDYRWREHVLRGEVHDGNAHALGGVAGHAGLFGTAEEVARIVLAAGPGGGLGLPSAQSARLFEAASVSDDRTFGMVLARASGAARGVLPDEAPGHVGFTGTSLWWLPGRRTVCVLLTNRVHPAVAAADFQPVRARFHRDVLATLAGGDGATASRSGR